MYEISPANHGMQKTFMYIFTLGIFPRFEGIFGMYVPLSPYKRGTRARVKGFRTFEVRAVFWRFFVSSCVICASDLNVFAFYSPVFGELIWIFGYPPNREDQRSKYAVPLQGPVRPVLEGAQQLA
jgi:hypothetical protein